MEENRHIVFIGTGLVSLLSAYLLAKQNSAVQITMIDSRPIIGGAWYSDVSPKGHEIECGCHIWSYEPSVYAYLESELGLKLEKKSPPPIFVGAKLRLPYSVKSTVDSYKYLLTIPFKKSRTLGRFRSNPHFRLKLTGKQNKYPPFGSPELIAALHKKLSALNNVSFRLSTHVQAVSVKEKVVIQTKNESLTCDKVFLTSVSDIAQITSPDKNIVLHQKQIDYIHFLLALNKPLKKKLFYWRLMNDRVIHRISDISYQTKQEEQLLLIGIKGDAYAQNTEEALFNHCKKTLSELGLVDDTYVISKVKTHIFPTYYLDSESNEQIALLDTDKVEVIHTTDLIYGFYYLLKSKGII